MTRIDIAAHVELPGVTVFFSEVSALNQIVCNISMVLAAASFGYVCCQQNSAAE